MLIQGYSSSADTDRWLDTRRCRRAYENDEGGDVEGAGRVDGESIGAESSEGGGGAAWGRGLGEAGYARIAQLNTQQEAERDGDLAGLRRMKRDRFATRGREQDVQSRE
jgi:hypothetical protein